MEFLAKLWESKEKRSPLKLLLTSRTELRGSEKVDDFEESSLKRALSEKLVIPKGMTDVKPHQMGDLISIAKGFPLLLKGLAATWRRDWNWSSGQLIPQKLPLLWKNSKVEEDIRERHVSFEDEGVDVNQMSAISLMFDALSTERLNGCQISRYRPVRGYRSVRGSCSQPNNFYCWWRSKSKEVWHSPTLA